MKIEIIKKILGNGFVIDISELAFRTSFVVDNRLDPDDKLDAIVAEIAKELVPLIRFNLKHLLNFHNKCEKENRR